MARQRDDSPDLFSYAAAKSARGEERTDEATSSASPVPGSQQAPLSIAELVKRSSKAVEQAVGTVWIEGEVSSVSRASSGHVYLMLKDDTANLRAVMWRSAASRLRFQIEMGQHLRCRGQASIYERDGKFQFYVQHAEPAGLGSEALALEQLKRQLAAEGLFAPERKRPLPSLPRRIGVVTSRSGAAIRDVVRAVWRRYPVPLLLADAAVQGREAPAQIVAALRALYQCDVDVIIVGRGGGSAADLAAFNDESVVRAIAQSPVPTISAVGHEIDVSFADLVADQRAATPTMAGEMAVPVHAELTELLHVESARLRREMELCLRAARQDLDSMLADCHRHLMPSLNQRRRMLSELGARLGALHPRARIMADRSVLVELENRLLQRGQRTIAGAHGDFTELVGRLRAMSPLEVLQRGYALATTADGHVLSDASSVNTGESIAVRLARGSLSCTVDEKQHE